MGPPKCLKRIEIEEAEAKALAEAEEVRLAEEKRAQGVEEKARLEADRRIKAYCINGVIK